MSHPTHWPLCVRSSHLALPHNGLAYQLGQQSQQPHPPHLPAGRIDTHSSSAGCNSSRPDNRRQPPLHCTNRYIRSPRPISRFLFVFQWRRSYVSSVPSCRPRRLREDHGWPPCHKSHTEHRSWVCASVIQRIATPNIYTESPVRGDRQRNTPYT